MTYCECVCKSLLQFCWLFQLELECNRPIESRQSRQCSYLWRNPAIDWQMQCLSTMSSHISTAWKYLDGIFDLNPFVPPTDDDDQFVPAELLQQSHDRLGDLGGRGQCSGKCEVRLRHFRQLRFRAFLHEVNKNERLHWLRVQERNKILMRKRRDE